jgi:hypothetical protein
MASSNTPDSQPEPESPPPFPPPPEVIEEATVRAHATDRTWLPPLRESRTIRICR